MLNSKGNEMAKSEQMMVALASAKKWTDRARANVLWVYREAGAHYFAPFASQKFNEINAFIDDVEKQFVAPVQMLEEDTETRAEIARLEKRLAELKSSLHCQNF